MEPNVDIRLHCGDNVIDGITVSVARRRARHLIVRVKQDGSVALTVPQWGAILAQGAVFLRSKWEWVLRTRERILAHPAPPAREFTPMDIARLQTLLGELHSLWAVRLGEYGVSWKLRRMKTGVCATTRKGASPMP